MESLEIKELNDSLLRNSYTHEDVDNIYTNQALKLLNSLNKAVGDTALSWFNYIVKMKLNSLDMSGKIHNNQIESEIFSEDLVRSISSFSEDFTKILTSIIEKSKNDFIREKIGIEPRVIESWEKSEKLKDSSILTSPDSNLNQVKLRLSYSKNTPRTIVSENLRTPHSKKRIWNSVRRDLFQNAKEGFNSSPQRIHHSQIAHHSKISHHCRNRDWI